VRRANRARTDWHDGLSAALATGDVREMTAAVARVPRNILRNAAPYLAGLAKEHVREGRPDEALACLDRLVATEPDNVAWLMQRAQVHRKLDNLHELVADARRIVTLSPENVEGHRLLAQGHDELRQISDALSAYREVLRLAPTDEHAKERLTVLEEQLRKQEMVRQVLDPQAAQAATQSEPVPLPQIVFDPALTDASIPASFDTAMVEGLKAHLRRYGGHQSIRDVLDRLDDPEWLAAWDGCLAQTENRNVLFSSSELGTFAVRALNHGAARVVSTEKHALEARIASGVLHKNVLMKWHAAHGAQAREWSEEQKKASFEGFAARVEVCEPEAALAQERSFDWLMFPDIDHTLLGTGIATAARVWRERGLLGQGRLMPGKARVFAMGIEFQYSASGLDFQPLEAFAWSPYPTVLPRAGWRPLTAPMELGTLDLANVVPRTWECALPVSQSGRLGALIFWFELDLGHTVLSSGPQSASRFLRPAVHHVDARTLQEGEVLQIEAEVSETRIELRPVPRSTHVRTHLLPGWHVPMLLDTSRNAAYEEAFRSVLQAGPVQTALDIGAGTGVLSMIAARAGVGQIYGCEVDDKLCRTGEEIVARNGLGDRVKLIDKDCRKLQVPQDMPVRADLALFELFDCSLIGEGILHMLAYAREHLLEPSARYAPVSARIRAMLVEYRIGQIWDVDAALLNPYRFSPSFINVDAQEIEHRVCSEPFEVFSFDFATATPEPGQTQIEVPATEEGTVGAVLFWFDLQMSQDRWISNAPGSAFHWKQGLQFLPEVQVTKGMPLHLGARHDGSSLSFAWKLEQMPRERFSRVPRFDPRWLHQATELQSQTADLFRHCAASPSEYAKVAELARRFALDPAAHGIAPRIAQRFAGKFAGL
jgi:protein arginine N-methyltransferase 7